MACATLVCLRDAPDLAARHPGAPAKNDTRLHATMRGRARQRTACELCRSVLRKSAAGGLHVRGARFDLVQAVDLLVDPLQDGDKDLLASQGLLCGAREAL